MSVLAHLFALLPLLLPADGAPAPVPVVIEGMNIPGVGDIVSVGAFSATAGGGWIATVLTDHPDPAADELVLQDGAVLVREGDASPTGFFGEYSEFLDVAGLPGGRDLIIARSAAIDLTPATDVALYDAGVELLQAGDAASITQLISLSGLLLPDVDALHAVEPAGPFDDALVVSGLFDTPQFGQSHALIHRFDGEASWEALVWEGRDDTPWGTLTEVSTNPRRFDVKSVDRFHALVRTDEVPGTNTRIVTFSPEAGGWTTRLRGGTDTSSPDPGRDWQDLFSHDVAFDANAAGDIVIVAALEGNIADAEMVLHIDAATGTPAVIARAGSFSPPLGSPVNDIFSRVALTDAGEVIWMTDFEGGTTAALLRDEEILVQYGDTIDGAALLTFSDGTDIGLDVSEDDRRVFFTGTLTDGRSGVFCVDLGQPYGGLRHTPSPGTTFETPQATSLRLTGDSPVGATVTLSSARGWSTDFSGGGLGPGESLVLTVHGLVAGVEQQLATLNVGEDGAVIADMTGVAPGTIRAELVDADGLVITQANLPTGVAQLDPITPQGLAVEGLSPFTLRLDAFAVDGQVGFFEAKDPRGVRFVAQGQTVTPSALTRVEFEGPDGMTLTDARVRRDDVGAPWVSLGPGGGTRQRFTKDLDVAPAFRPGPTVQGIASPRFGAGPSRELGVAIDLAPSDALDRFLSLSVRDPSSIFDYAAFLSSVTGGVVDQTVSLDAIASNWEVLTFDGGFQTGAIPSGPTPTTITTAAPLEPLPSTFVFRTGDTTEIDLTYAQPFDATIDGVAVGQVDRLVFRASIASLPIPVYDVWMATSGHGTNSSAATVTPWAWQDAGFALPGLQGLSELTVTGTMTGGTAHTLDLVNAPPATAAFMVLALAPQPLPFKGGYLIAPPLVTIGSQLDGTGTLSLPFIWTPGVPAGIQTSVQFVVLDVGAPNGFSLSNAVVGTAP